MGRELVAVVGIAGGISDHRLAGAAHAIERGADVGDRGLAAAGEDVEIERDRLDPVVARRGVQPVHELGEAILPPRPAPAEGAERARLRGLLDDRAVKIEQQRAARRAVAIGAGGQQPIEAGEEGEQQDEDEGVLDADQQPPDPAREAHPEMLLHPSARPARGSCKSARRLAKHEGRNRDC